MNEIKKLTQANKDTFFDSVVRGNAFTYSQTFFFDEVDRLAQKKDVIIHYCKPHTRLYRKYGCFTCRVVQTPNDPPEKKTEDKLIDGILEVSDKIKEGKSPSIFEVAMIMLRHLGDDAKVTTFSKTKRIKLDDENNTGR